MVHHGAAFDSAAGAGPEQRGEALDEIRALLESGARRDEPLHVRLREALLDALARGRWSSGDKLPPEAEIAKRTGVSLGTVQRALTHLANDHVVLRRHGSGTFVSGDASQTAKLMHFRFIADDGTAIVPVYAEAIERGIVHSTGPWSHFLEGTKSFIRLRRRINVSNEFDCLSELYIDADRFGAVLDLPLQSLDRIVIRDVLAHRFNAPTFSLAQRMYATQFDAEVLNTLKLNGSNPFGLVLEVFSFTHHRQPLAFQNIFIPGDARRLEIPNPRVIK